MAEELDYLTLRDVSGGTVTEFEIRDSEARETINKVNTDLNNQISSANNSLTSRIDSIANAAKKDAATAQSTADTANTTAVQAKTAAEDAQTTAGKAQTTADKAKQDAATAQDTADKAYETAADAYRRTLHIEVSSRPADGSADTSTLTATVWRGGELLSEQDVAKLGIVAWYVDGARKAMGWTYTCAAGTAVECRLEA